MKTFIRLFMLLAVAITFTACANKKDKEKLYHRKIYLTEQDYLNDIHPKPPMNDRREDKPVVESEYIFRVKPEKEIYFFDYRNQPQIPGEPGEREYRDTKRLWNKPKRYSPQQYYGTDAQQEASEPAPETSPYDTYDF